MISLADIRDAHARISPYIRRTPLLRAAALDSFCGCQVYLKPENLQITGSFKLRGATNKLLSLSEEEKTRGIIAASSGNHGQAVAYAAQRLGLDAIIVMPSNAPPAKMDGVKSYGARLEIFGTLSSEREARMAEIAAKESRTQVHPYNDPQVSAGQGTAALEALEDEPELDVFVSQIGGGGLIGGLATAAKGVSPGMRFIGCEPAAAPRYQVSRANCKPSGIELGNTIADGTRTDRAVEKNFMVIEKLVGELYSVDDKHIKQAMYLYAQKAKLVVEPSGALSLAAMLGGQIKCKPSDKVCLMISGGNLDLDKYALWLQEGSSLLASR